MECMLMTMSDEEREDVCESVRKTHELANIVTQRKRRYQGINQSDFLLVLF